MAIANGYASLAEVKAAARITDTVDDALLEIAIESASRAIDGHTHRNFYVVGTALSTRVFATGNSDFVWIDDVASTTGFEGAGIECDYVPHAFESVFAPTTSIVGSDGSAKSPRELMNIGDDRFVVMMNAANKGIVPNRKSFGENLLAFSLFAKKHDDALLYLHTEQFGAMGGIDLVKLVNAVGIPEHQVKFVDQFAYRNQIPNHILAGLYSMSDVLLSVSMGEGFGIPVIEAQACGTPVIVSDWTAQPELCGDGWVVETQPWWDPMQDSWFATPLVSGIVDALEQAYSRGGGHSDKAVTWASEYSADNVFTNNWLPLLEKL